MTKKSSWSKIELQVASQVGFENYLTFVFKMDCYTLMILYLLDILTGSFSKCGFFTFPNFVVCVSFFLVFYVRNLWFLLATKPTKHQCHCCIVAHINWKSKNIVHISCLKANKSYISKYSNIDLILWHPQLIVDAVKCLIMV